MTMGHRKSALREYRDVGASTRVTSADPHTLILMLMNGALDAMAAARGCVQRGAVEEKVQSFTRAINIIDGLRASLDRSASPDLADNLDDLYQYMGRRLLHANLHDDDAAVDEVAGLLREIKSAWEAIPVDLRQRADVPIAAV
jgi:flagellar secretion chaperone FliS